MNITVYLGATPGNDPALEPAVRALGTWIGKNGHDLVYGGSRCGLMGMLAESVLEAGGRVTGVEPKFFVDDGFVYDAITELIVTKDMSERKAKMIELGDAFIAFPGGTGTLEEIAEIMSKVALRHLDAPCVLYNLNGYYSGLHALLSRMVASELSTPEKLSGITFADSLDDIARVLSRTDRL
ncbi:MAG: TIGR00730 family Rossman fold protein [Clostridia bacterium]|nr:TIGR00730 family Rossman fold protein [Clostridia bacterium]